MTEEPWTGQVTDVTDTEFAAEFARGDREYVVTFNRVHLPDVEEGDIVMVADEKIHRVHLGNWTQEELDDIRRRAREMAESVKDLID